MQRPVLFITSALACTLPRGWARADIHTLISPLPIMLPIKVLKWPDIGANSISSTGTID